MRNTSDWEVFRLEDLIADTEEGILSMKEFLRTASLSCSIYHVPAGSNEMAKAHEEDELYLILKGRGHLKVGEHVHEVNEGTLMYVHAACEHSYFDIEESITALAFFGAPIRSFR